MQKYLLTVVGEDRPGIIASIAQKLYQWGCNLEDSSMTLLRGNFAMMMLISSSLHPKELSKKLEEIRKKFNLLMEVQDFNYVERTLPSPVPTLRHYLITVTGKDMPGILYHITSLLARHNINISDMSIRIIDENLEGSYISAIEVETRLEKEIYPVREELNKLAESLNISLSLDPLDNETI